jgi:hypothetical protein
MRFIINNQLFRVFQNICPLLLLRSLMDQYAFSLWLGAIETQWFWLLWPELEAQDRGDSLTLTMVGCHWDPVIRTTLARIGSPGPGRFPYSFQMIPRGPLGAWITGNPHTTRPFILNKSSCTWTCKINWSGKTRTWTQDPNQSAFIAFCNYR